MNDIKKMVKRFKLSEWLIICQLISSIIALILSNANNYIADAFGLVWNIFNSIAILIVFLRNNAKNYKSYEITGQFIFSKLGNSFSDFMDYLMSDEYKPNSFEEQSLLQDSLYSIAKDGSYEDRRKISRALPYLYNIDKKMTYSIACVLRDDIFDENTDIRRRTIESALSIIQNTVGTNKQKKLYRKYKHLFGYWDMDDSYTIVASIESYFYCYSYIADSEKEKKAILKEFNIYKEKVIAAYNAGIGRIRDTLIEDIDTIWDVLMSLYKIGHTSPAEHADSRKFVEEIIKGESGTFAKLAVVKNLYYTCKSYPNCLNQKSCPASSSGYMMTAINYFLTSQLEGDIFLSMPTVRYFDCVCNNLHQRSTRKISLQIMQNYYTHSNMLINQTAFDKFARLMSEAPDFGREILSELLENNTELLKEESNNLQEKINQLPPEKQEYFSITQGRTKIKKVNCSTYKQQQYRESDDQIREIDAMIDAHHDRIRFISKIKDLKEGELQK